MTPTKILVVQILVVFAVVIGGLWVATQWMAAELGYQPQLGTSWFLLLGWQVYYPWRFFEWWYAFDAYAPTIFNRAAVIAASSGIVGCGFAIVGSLWRARQHRFATTYGSSRWATEREISRASLFHAHGVFSDG